MLSGTRGRSPPRTAGAGRGRPPRHAERRGRGADDPFPEDPRSPPAKWCKGECSPDGARIQKRLRPPRQISGRSVNGSTSAPSLSNNCGAQATHAPASLCRRPQEMRIPAAAVHHLDARHRRALGLATEWACWVERGVSRFRPVRPRAATAGLIIHQRRAGDRDAPPTRSIRSIKSRGRNRGRERGADPCRRGPSSPSGRLGAADAVRISVRQRMRCLTSAVGAGAGTRRTGRRFDGRVPRLRCATGSMWSNCCNHPRRRPIVVSAPVSVSVRAWSCRPRITRVPAKVMTLRRPITAVAAHPMYRRPTARYRPAGIDVAVLVGRSRGPDAAVGVTGSWVCGSGRLRRGKTRVGGAG